MTSALIVNGTVVTGAGSQRMDLEMRDGRVVAWHADASQVEAEERHDAAGLWVIPGGIDVHTHFEEPDPNLLEGFVRGGMAALAGGVTTVVEMPQAHPTTTTASLLEEKADLVARNGVIDMALWGGAILANGQTEDDLRAMAAAGAVGLKSFMASSSPFFPAVETAQLLAVMRIAAETGLPYGLHAEDDALLRSGIAGLRGSGRTDPLAHAESRPPLVETVAVAVALALAEESGAHVHLCHVASSPALRLIAEAKRRGLRVTCETCPQYLVLDTTDLERLRGFGRCAPALRDPAEVAEIWPYVLDGTIDVLCSDHCGFTAESKARGDGDIFEAPLGLPGVQTLIPSTFGAAVVERGMDPSAWVRLVSETPARLFGLPGKGSLAPGSDADLVLFDPNREWTATAEDHLHRQPWTPYEGKRMHGRVVRTFLRGQAVFDDSRLGPGRVTATPGTGRWLRRA